MNWLGYAVLLGVAAIVGGTIYAGTLYFDWVGITFLCIGIYLVLGCVVATGLMQTPYADNGFLIMMALWPVFVAGLIWG